MDNKVKLEIKTPENKTIEYNGVNIEINPFIDFSNQVLLINAYIEDYFGDTTDIAIQKTKYHIFESECKLKNYIIQLNTNIDMSDVDNDIYVDNVLWYAITEEIINWNTFKSNLDNVVSEIKEQIKLDNSLGKVLSDILEKAEGFIDQINKISPDDIKELQEVGTGLINDLEKANIMRNPSDLSAVEQPLIDELNSEGIKKV
jgi:hypothetical protein